MASLAHVGIVVVDLEKAMAEMSLGLGVEWKEVQIRQNGPVTLRVTFSKKAPFLELIQGQPGSSWDTSKGSVLEREGIAPFGGAWSYHQNASGGFRIELCDTRGRQAWMDCWGMSEQDMEGL